MKPNGYDKSQNRQKWRCPLANGTKNTCKEPCSTAKYGRTFHTFSKDNLRLYLLLKSLRIHLDLKPYEFFLFL